MEGYNICTRQILNNDHLTDYCLAVYQQHNPSCLRNLTQYTVKSVENILLFIEQFKISGLSTAFCSFPKNTARPDSPIFCFTCIQLHCLVQSMHLKSIERHFSYKNQANGNFTLNAIQSPVNVNFFKASSIFHVWSLSRTSGVCRGRLESVADVGGLSRTSGVCHRRRESVTDVGSLSQTSGVCHRRRESVTDVGSLSELFWIVDLVCVFSKFHIFQNL